MKYHLLVILTTGVFLLANCGKGSKPGEKASLVETTPLPVDSFTVSGIDDGHQVQSFQYLDDSTLCSYNLVNHDLAYFVKKKPNSYYVISHKSIETEPWGSHVIGDDHLNYFISRENTLTTYDEKGDKKISARPIVHIFEHLKDSFLIVSSHDVPLIKKHDTLITFYAFNSMRNYSKYFQEPGIAEFKLKKDSVLFINNYLLKPAGLENYYYSIAKYCFNHNKVFLLYPCYDTIYTYNRTNHTSSKICIHNKDYKLPEHYDNSRAFKPEYGSYLTKYSLSNFEYSAIYYNELTHHFILFYFAPVTEQFKDRMATPADQKMKAVILNEALEVIGYDLFDIKGYVTPESYFYIPGKGLAIPTVKSTEDYETTKFYIYNL